MDWLLLIILIIVIAIILFVARRHIVSYLGRGGPLLYSDNAGEDRAHKREKIRATRRSHQWKGFEEYQDSQANKLLNSQWKVVDNAARKRINITGDINGYIEVLDWPNTDSWMFYPDKAGVLGSYCLDMTKENDEKIISRINLYLTAERT